MWGRRQRHYVRGTINDTAFDGSLGSRAGKWFFPVNKKLQQEAGVGAGDEVRIVLEIVESQEAPPPEDLRIALDGEPDAAVFFQGLSGFYRRQYVGWIEGAKKAETRPARVAEVVDLLKRGRTQR